MKRGGGVHTVRYPERRIVWCNMIDGKVGMLHPTKRDAVRMGRLIAKAHQKEHTIHRKDGVISAKNSYGRDPRKVPG